MGTSKEDRAIKGSRAKTIHLSHDYTYPAGWVWGVVIDLDHLKTITKGLVSFRNLPSGQIYQGQHIQVDVSLFSWMPYQPYEMTVIALDHEKMSFQSDEVGAGVKSWRHSLRVSPHKDGCRISEEIEIDAGMATPIFAAWARFLYRRRHKPRLQILASLEQGKGNHQTTTNFQAH
ncbi:SRPBCC family protein [uncultured Roseobacter sp.]|uniref:SRPBCC family protein n=1 Tax=uncultured Roseobacter sp. TaxID=114847 RepID=UPI002617F561|nr:SRPBCC family protein [uncultured Roseobacter sp.]